eukprot:SAG22_NODE_288_length_12949_cov_163.316265_8_plen_73_part_00
MARLRESSSSSSAAAAADFTVVFEQREPVRTVASQHIRPGVIQTGEETAGRLPLAARALLVFSARCKPPLVG